MSDPAIRIRVGAAVDRNIGNAFRPIIDAAKDARRQVEDEMDRLWAAVGGGGKRAGKAGQGPYRSVVREAERAANQVVAAERRKQRQIESEERKATRRRESAERHVARIKDRHFATQQREGERSDKLAARSAERSRKDNVGRLRGVAGGSVETLGKIGRGAVGVAGNIARGAGVQTDLGSYVGQAVALEARAADLSNAAYDPSKREGRRSPGSIVSQARAIGDMAGFDPEKVIEGLQAFVGKTGDLKTGEAALEDMARLARATGTNLEDMVGAAGEAALALGDVGPGKAFETNAQKAQALSDVLRVLAGQGKIGAIEMRDLAQYGGRLAAASRQFGGDAKKNMGDMGALAQISKQEGGGAINAAEAAMSVSGLVNTLKTNARQKEFEAAGVKTMDASKNFLPVREILKNAAAAAVGDPTKFKKMFANVVGGKAADPSNRAYREAYNKELAASKDKKKADAAGRSAIDEMFDRFSKGIGEQEEKESFGVRMKTAEVQVQQFNNELSKIGGQIAERVLPQLQKLAPYVVSAAEAFAKFVSFAAENPGTAITGAIIASIGKAAIGSAVSGAVTKLVEGAGAGMTGKAALTLGIVSIAITTATIVAQHLNEKKKAGYEDIKAGVAETDKVVAAAEKEYKEKKTLSPETQEALDRARANIMATEKEAKDYQALGGDARYYQGGLGIAGGAAQAYDIATGKTSSEQIGRGASAQDQMYNLEQLRASIDGMRADMAKNAGKTQKVEITNLPGAPGPVANTANTTK